MNAGSAPGGYSSEKSRYGTWPLEHRIAVALVRGRVDDLAIAERSHVQHRPGHGEQQHGESRRGGPTPAARPSQSLNAGRLADRVSTRLLDGLLRELLDRRQQGEGDERQEPGEVEVEPVREDDLEADQQKGRERGQLQRRLATGVEAHGYRGSEERRLQAGLRHRQVRVSGVLCPVPDRER